MERDRVKAKALRPERRAPPVSPAAVEPVPIANVSGPGNAIEAVARSRVPVAVTRALASEKGEPLARASLWSQRVGADVSGARVVVGAAAADAAAAIDARAFTVGDRMFFAEAGDLQRDGGALLAHELAHVAQQRGAPPPASWDQLPFVGDDDAHEQAARDHGPISTSPMAIARAPAEPPMSGALVFADDLKKKTRADDQFTGPITWSVLGDRFEVALARSRERDDELVVTISYVGTYPVDSYWMPGKAEASRTQRISTRRRYPPDERKDLPFNAKILGRASDAISYDLFGDGIEILVIKDTVDDGNIAKFDRRTHMMSVAINGFPMDPRWFEVHLPSDVTSGPEAVLARNVSLLRDQFTLRARRHGDASAVVLSLANATQAQQVIVPYAAQRKLALDILGDDTAIIEVDLDGDRKVDATLVHKVRKFPPHGISGRFAMDYDLVTGEPRPEPAPYYTHEVAVYSPGGVLVGRMIHKMQGYPGPIPSTEDALIAPPRAGAPLPATSAPQQGDLSGEASRPIQSTGRDWELRIDGDGDRTKELLLRFIPQQPDTYDKPQVYTFRVTQISTGISGEADFRISGSQANSLTLFGPRVMTTPDGHTYGKLDLGGATLEYGRSTVAGTPTGFLRYDFRFGNVAMSFFPPSDPSASQTTLLTVPGDGAPTKDIAGILAADIQLTEYRDPFRATVQRVGSDEVLFGLAAMRDGAPVAGLQTRLLHVHDLRLAGVSTRADRASFFVDDAMEPLNITSALDPPKDEQGRPIENVPPSSHRDHRVTVWGPSVLGDISRTFQVRYGKFVPLGWKKEDPDAQLAAGNADAVGVLQEQARHPHLAEMRVQIDAALDSAIVSAVDKGYVSQRNAASWTALKTAMVMISSQSTSGRPVDSIQVLTAIDSVKQVDDWIELESNTTGTVSPSEVTDWRLGETSDGRSTIVWSGTGKNVFTGTTFDVRNSVIGEEQRNSTTYGRLVASSLRAYLWQMAIEWYAKFRDGMRRWIQLRYTRDAKDGQVSGTASQLDYLGKMDTELGKLDQIQSERVALDASIDREVALAATKGLISSGLATVWINLREGMVALTAQTGGEALDKQATAICVTSALALSTWLANETTDRVYQFGPSRANAYTGETQAKNTSDEWVVQSAVYGQRIATYLEQNRPGLAGQAYSRLRDGVVRWLAKKYETDASLKDVDAAARLGKLQKERAGKRDVVRVPAIYQADESFEQMPDDDGSGYRKADFGKYKTVPLTVFVWADEGKWQIRDVTNPDHVWSPNSDVEFNDEEQPPEALFKLLDNSKHLPKGHLTYLLPDGTGKKIRLESKKKWYEYVRTWAMVIGLIALALLGGAVVVGFLFATVAAAMTAVAVPVFIASTLSAAMNVTADVAEIVDGKREGWLDSTTLFMDVLDIAVNIATLGAGAAGKLAMGAEAAVNAEKAGTGVAWSGFKAFAGKTGSMLYKPLMGLSIAGNALNAVVMTHDMIKALEEIDKIPDPVARLKARAQLIATWAASSALIVLSLHGDLPAFGKGAPTIVLDNVNGRTFARAVDVSVGKTHVNVPSNNANAYASARWAAEEVEKTATTGRGAAKTAATDALENKQFQEWYAQWLENPHRIDEHGRVIVPDKTPAGYAERAQAMIDRGDGALHKQAFDTADDVAALRKDAEKLGLDIDPHGEHWKTARSQLEDALAKKMGPERARTVVSRYEAARLGGKGDAVDFAVQRAKVGKVLPDTEVNRITKLYEGNEVHVTGDLTSPQGGNSGVVEVAVVVPNDTSPEVMAAMEQRARGHKVMQDPEVAKATGRDSLELRAKVMTEDQFFGMATASRKGKAPPRYVRIDQPVAGVVELGVPSHQHSPTHYSVEPQAIDQARATMATKHPEGRVGKVKYDARTNTAYFEVHGTKAGGVVRVESALPPRITGAGDWGNSNRIIGTHVFGDADAAKAALHKVHTGDFASLGETAGVHPPENAAEGAKGIEFGIGELSDGRYVIVKGDFGVIDWAEMPGVTGRSHTHPDIEANNLSPDIHGAQRQVPLVEIERPPALGEPPSLDGAKIQPSGADLVYAAQHSGGHQGVLTPYVVQDGMVYKPGQGPPLHEGVPPDARLEYEVTGAVEVGTLGDGGPVVVRAELQGTFNGKPVSRKTVWATGATPTEKAGLVHLTEPEGIVATKPAAKEPAQPPTKPELTAPEIDAVKTKLTTAVNEQIAAHALPVSSTPEVRVLPASEFESRFASERGRAVFQLEGDKGVIYAHPEARKLDIASEMEHVRQMEDPRLAAEVRILHGGALGEQWKGLPATERIGQFRRKLDLEIDAAEHLLAKQPPGSPEHIEVSKTLEDLLALRNEVDSFSPQELSAMNAGVKALPQYLETPPWLFSKNRDKSARPARPAKIDKKDLVALPSGKTSEAEQAARSTQYNDGDVETVSQVGNSWKEHDDLHSGYNGTVHKRTGAGGKKFLVVTNESGVEHLYQYSGEATLEPKFVNAPDESIPVAQRPKVEIKAGEKFGAEPAREYRWVEVEYTDGRPPKLVEEIKSRDNKLGWRERGASKTERGEVVERAAVAQEDARLGPRLDADGNVKYSHIPSQEGRAGFDDIIVEFAGTREKPTAKLRVREVKDYPNKTVPFGEYTAITDNLKTNWEQLDAAIAKAERAVAKGVPMPKGFEGMSEQQILALRKAYDAKMVKVEIVLGPGTHANPVGRKGGVHAQLKAKIEDTLGKGSLVDAPTTVEDGYVKVEIEKNADKPPAKPASDE